MNAYTTLLFVHVASATCLLGGSLVATPLLLPAARRARTREELRAVLSLARPLGVVNPVASLVVMLTGASLAHLVHAWALGWVQLAAALWILNALLAVCVVKPQMARLGASVAAAAEGPLDEAVDSLRRSATWTRAAGAMALNDVVLLLLMTVKPGPAGAALALVSPWLLASTVHLVLRVRAARSRVRRVTRAEA